MAHCRPQFSRISGSPLAVGGSKRLKMIVSDAFRAHGCRPAERRRMRIGALFVLLLVPTMGPQARDHARATQKLALLQIGDLLSSDSSHSVRQLGQLIGLKASDKPRRWNYDPPDFGSTKNYVALWRSSNRSTWIEAALFHYSGPQYPSEYIELKIRPSVCLRLHDLVYMLGGKIQFVQIPIVDSMISTDPDHPALLKSYNSNTISNVEIKRDRLIRLLNGIRMRKLDGSAAPLTIDKASNDCIAKFNIEAEPPLPDPPLLFNDDPNQGLNLS